MSLQTSSPPIKVALIDLYNGEPNQGIRAITGMIKRFSHSASGSAMSLDRFETRLHEETPDLSYDIYLLSGGPGSPFEGQNQRWETQYFNLVDKIWNHNEAQRAHSPGTLKFAFFICHSFQLMCRHFSFGEVVKRQSESFGIVKTHQTKNGKKDPLFTHLADPFYATDIRKWQVINPNSASLQEMGSEVIAIEKERTDPDWERALMGIRITPEMAGVQFHPEADPEGMLVHFQDPNRKEGLIHKLGPDNYEVLIERLKRPEFIEHTYNTIIPNFLNQAASTLRGSS